MYQILFRLPSFLPVVGGAPIYGYGVMMVVGFFLAMALAKFLARRSKLDPEIFANAALIALVAGVVGARLSHVLENLPDYTRNELTFGQNLWNAVNIRSGGLTYYGGFLLAFPALIAYGWFKRVPLPLGMDIIAPCLMVGLGLGRVGCYLNGCCYGAETNVSWAVQFPYRSDAYFEQLNRGRITVPPELLNANGVPRSIEDIQSDRTIDSAQRAALVKLAQSQKALPVHPAELYSTATALLIAAFLLAFFTLPHAPGRVFALMLMVEGVSRFLLETVRAEPVGTFFGHHIFGPLTFGEGLSIVNVGLGVLLWFVFGSSAIRGERAPAAKIAAA
jgi:phosphatidylglycerol:prolipoprotein diacylglycerol transferase